jgi:hypothetical protein
VKGDGELGIRVALGARYGQVVGIVVGHGARLVAAGLGVGFAIALAGARVLLPLRYGASAADPPTYEAVFVGLITVAALASCVPPAGTPVSVRASPCGRSEVMPTWGSTVSLLVDPGDDPFP